MAVKFTNRDGRDRASREFNTLTVLQNEGVRLAPKPLLLSPNNYRQPLVVQSWLHGRVSDTPPANESEWRLLLGHLTAVHVVRSDTNTLPRAVLNVPTVAENIQVCQRELAAVPPAVQTPKIAHPVNTNIISSWR